MSSPEKPVSPRSAGDAASHARYRDLIGHHLEGDLSPAETEELFAHLGVCESCREVLEAEKRLTDRLRRLPRMMAPSDLRAQILREALRDRERSMSALDAGDRLAALTGHADAGEGAEEPAVFECGRPRAGHRRRLALAGQWQAAAAIVFLIAASAAALLTGDFRSVAPLARLQQSVREAGRVVVALATGTGLRQREESAPTGLGPVAAPAETRTSGNELEGRRPALVHLQIPRIEETGRGLNRLISKRLAQVSETMSRLAAEATESSSMPGPAEAERPAIAAIVLRSQPAADARTFDTDELSDILTAANRDPAASPRVQAQDQFVFNGRRYRCYTVLVTPEWLQHMTRALDIYRAPADVPVLRAISDQGHRLPRTEQVAFYTAPVSAVRAAAGALAAGDAPAKRGSTPRPLQVFVVDE